MAAMVYSLCTLTALLCAWMLLSAYRRRGTELLFWSGLAFAGLTANNLLLVLDKLVFLKVDLSVFRNVVSLLAMIILLYGLIWRAK